MTVKCLTPYQQDCIIIRFVKGDSIDTLATGYNRSRRTIIRVLEDRGVDPKIHRRPGRSKPKPPPVIQEALPLAPEAGMWGTPRPTPIFPRDMPEPIRPDPGLFPGFPVHPLLIQTPDSHTYGRPWYRRLADSVRRFFRAYPTSMS